MSLYCRPLLRILVHPTGLPSPPSKATMPRLRSDDPVSQAIASSFLDFLQHNLQLATDADAESLAVATECLAAIFRLDPAAFGTPRQPELLPHIFRLLLSQGPGSFGQSTQQRPESGQRHLDGGQSEPNTASAPGIDQQPGNAASGGQRSGEQRGLEGEVHGANAAREALLGDNRTANESPSAPESSVLPTTPTKVSPQEGEGPSTPQQLERGSKGTGASVQAEGLADEAPRGGAATSGKEQGGEDAVMAEAEGGDDAVGTGRRREAKKEKEDTSGSSPAGASWDRAREDLKKEAEQLKKQGNEAMSSEHFYEAIELYTQAISLVDTDAIYYSNRAAAHTQLRQFDLAIKDCEQSIKLDPRYARAYSRLGLAYFEKGDYQTAIDRGFLKALEIDPENAIVKQNLKAAQEKLARQSQRQQPERPPPAPSASSGPPPTGAPHPPPQFPPNVQGLANMAANLFTPLASMANGAAGSGDPPGVPGFPGFGANQGQPSGWFGATQGQASGSGQAPASQGGGNAAGPSQGQNQQESGAGSAPGAGQPGGQPVFTVNVGGDQVQQLLTQMFQVFGAAAQRNGQGGTGTGTGAPQNPS
ncbi:tetratricopeptide repeat domain-containing protein [Klebsormidium nitens]|uniref:Tetratricopeptide repeat domain-containing protein n=1 Tax=Klebsormidium nitens TaxID=105231 RepID=A0A1Y1I265_KLENI|nr:tetratricopeptide repeat domain-containing protein [Klebsormidium nitens]|eukprot:GAQ82218.1 tetratricopeptide repeat domain-containing protein [Klebsormidium nitens]